MLGISIKGYVRNFENFTRRKNIPVRRFANYVIKNNINLNGGRGGCGWGPCGGPYRYYANMNNNMILNDYKRKKRRRKRKSKPMQLKKDLTICKDVKCMFNQLLAKFNAAEKIIDDAVVIPNFVQDYLQLDVQKIFEDLQNIPSVYAGNEKYQKKYYPPIEYKPKEAQLIKGTHHALQYRGNALKRNKVWFQTDIDKGYRKYYYTGWQQMISMAQCDIKAMPKSTQELFNKLNSILPHNGKMNHGIFTSYATGEDNIGAHSDKERDFKKDSWFIIIKLGDARFFDFLEKDKKTGKEEVIWHKKLPAGTALFVKSSTANKKTLHAVPPMEGVGPSGSIVFRNIKTIVNWKKQKKEAAKARRKKFEATKTKPAKPFVPVNEIPPAPVPKQSY